MDEKTHLNTLCIVKDEPLEKVKEALEHIKLENESVGRCVEDCDSDLKQDLTGSNWTKTYVNEYDTSLDICKEEFNGNNFEMKAKANLPSGGETTVRPIDILSKTDKPSKEIYYGEASEENPETLLKILRERKRKSSEGDLENVNRYKKSLIVRHKQDNEKPFHCNICIFECGCKNQLVQHMITHIAKKLFSCSICDCQCERKQDLDRHMNTHNTEKPYSCHVCSYTFRRKTCLVGHMKTHTDEKQLPCKLCNDECGVQSNLIGHMRTYPGKKPFPSNLNDNKYDNKSTLIIQKKAQTGIPIPCNLCNCKYFQKCELDSHMKSHTVEKSVSSNHSSDKLEKESTSISQQKTRTEKPFSCNLCNYKCWGKAELDSHTKTHITEKSISSNFGNEKFENESTLFSQKRTRTEKRFSCNLCNYKSSRKSELANHTRMHTGEKPYLCNHCNFTCRLKYILVHHMRTHTGEKPFA